MVKKGFFLHNVRSTLPFERKETDLLAGINNNFQLLNTKGINPSMWIYIDCYGFHSANASYISKKELQLKLIEERVCGISYATASRSLKKMKELGVLKNSDDCYKIQIPNRTFVEINTGNARWLLQHLDSRTLLCYIWLKTKYEWKGNRFTFTTEDMIKGVYNSNKKASNKRYAVVNKAYLELMKSPVELKFDIIPKGSTFIKILRSIR